MSPTQRAGGVAGLVAGATFLFGLAYYGTQLIDFMNADTSADAVAFLADHHGQLALGNAVIHLLFGIALVPLTLAVRERLGEGWMSRAAAVFGHMWATVIIATGMITAIGYQQVLDLNDTDPAAAATAWNSLSAVIDGLGGGVELVGGMWVLLASLSGLATRTLPRWLHHWGLGVGAAGLVTAVPGLSDVGAIFGVASIVWFIAAGVVLLRGASGTPGHATASADSTASLEPASA